MDSLEGLVPREAGISISVIRMRGILVEFGVAVRWVYFSGIWVEFSVRCVEWGVSWVEGCVVPCLPLLRDPTQLQCCAAMLCIYVINTWYYNIDYVNYIIIAII